MHFLVSHVIFLFSLHLVINILVLFCQWSASSKSVLGTENFSLFINGYSSNTSKNKAKILIMFVIFGIMEVLQNEAVACGLSVREQQCS